MAKTQSQRGSALVYILIAIALLAALTATLMNTSNQQSSSQNTFDAAAELISQINFIRSAIQECVLTHPGGDTTNGYASISPPPVKPYPLKPTDTYLASPSSEDLVEYVGCPGLPGDSNDHARIFGGSTGKFLPPPPKLFDKWYYYTGADGVYFMIGSSNTDSSVQNAVQRVEDSFFECEVDIITADSTNVVMATEGDYCGAGSTCLRVWLVTNPTAIYQSAEENAECH